MEKTATLFVLICLIFSLCACGNEDSGKSAQIIGNFSAINLNGDVTDERIIQSNKITMINVWGTFCAPCIEEMPIIEKIYNDYSEKGFGVLGVVVDAADKNGVSLPNIVGEAKKITTKLNITYDNIIPNKTFYKDTLAEGQSTPITYFVDSNGNQIGKTVAGNKTEKQWRQIIDELMEDIK